MDVLQNITMATESPILSTDAGSSMATLNYSTSTEPYDPCKPTSNADIYPEYVGFLTAVVAIVFYGTNFAPVKKFDTGDGMFFQWIVCSAVMCCGIVVQLIRNSKFYPIVILGGVIWETGNICVVPIIKTIGLGLGLCIWGMANLLSGWATGRFGLFGLCEEKPGNEVLNYVGVGLAVISAVIFAMVKNEVSTAGLDQTITVTESDLETTSERSPLLGPGAQERSNSLYTTHNDTHDVIVFKDKKGSGTSVNRAQSGNNDDLDESFIDRWNPRTKRIVGLSLCVFSGILYGQTFTPATYAQDNYHNSSKNGLDYVFATFCGIYLTSSVYFFIYTAFQKNRPKVYPRAILPGFVSGLMWGVATSSWFVANKVLSNAIAFPIVTTGPAVIASLLGVFAFHEIKLTYLLICLKDTGRMANCIDTGLPAKIPLAAVLQWVYSVQGGRNYLILAVAMSVTITGAILTGLSKH